MVKVNAPFGRRYGVLSSIALLLAISCLILWPSAKSVSAQGSNIAGRDFPQLQLSGPARGAEAIDALGRRLSEVAAFYGKSEDELRQTLLQDRTAWVDREGRFLYICELDEPLSEQNEAERSALRGKSTAIALGPFALDQTFKLHSRPGAARVIYLDFDGHVTSGTSWNSSFNGGASFVTPAYDFDGNTASFSASELERIQYIWQRVTEDFAPFDVDVTTEDPGLEALRRSTSSDQNYGVRVVIGGSSYDWYGASAGGVAYVGSFTWNSDTPCYVWEAQLGNGHEKYTAEAISHEAGHTLGLRHDGQTNGTAYYQGHANWAPIMGVGYYKDVTQWSKGDYNLANNTEDDLQVMQNYGLSYRADDHGNTTSTATQLTGASPIASGQVERSTDVDVFSFATGAGQVSFTVAVAPRAPNLDVLVALLDAAGNTIASSNATTLGTTLSATLAAGSYYLRIDGVGTGDATTGYTDYASLGDYTLSGSIIDTGVRAPVASAAGTPTAGNAPLAVAFSSAGSSDADGQIVSYAWNFGNGVTSSLPDPSYTYTSAGTFTATLTVTDNDGLSASAGVVIAVNPPPNQLPVAVAGATPSSGYAPLAVAFSSAGSYDPDGTIVSYSWNFGNGATSTAANPSYTYTSVGTFTATLTVTDDRGGQKSGTVTISVAQNPNQVVFVSAINMSLVTSPSGNNAVAEVIIKDASGAVRPGATISGKWNGLVTGNVIGTTDASGRVVFSSKKSRKKGSFIFTVSNVSVAGYNYDPSRNLETSDSIANP